MNYYNDNSFSKEELRTTIIGLLVMGLMTGGVVYLDFENLSLIMQGGVLLGFVLGVYLIAPKRVRDYFSILPVLREFWENRDNNS